jgi:hypothetical protein
MNEIKTKLPLAIVPANNHFAGHGPGTANLTLKAAGSKGSSWIDSGQKLHCPSSSHQ